MEITTAFSDEGSQDSCVLALGTLHARPQQRKAPWHYVRNCPHQMTRLWSACSDGSAASQQTLDLREEPDIVALAGCRCVGHLVQERSPNLAVAPVLVQVDLDEVLSWNPLSLRRAVNCGDDDAMERQTTAPIPSVIPIKEPLEARIAPARPCSDRHLVLPTVSFVDLLEAAPAHLDVFGTFVKQTSSFAKQTRDRSRSRRLDDGAPVIALDLSSASRGMCLLFVLRTAARSDELDCEIVFRQELEAY
jgi:hypothetical protein